MRVKGARRILLLLLLAAPTAGCGASGDGSAARPTATPTGASWVQVAQGRPTASAAPGRRGSPSASASPSPWASTDPSCGRTREPDQVLIPVEVAIGSGELAVRWPGYGDGAGYRVAAVPQKLVNGEQPPVRWQSVDAGRGCTVTATIGGLIPGDPYVVWLDAPDAPRLRDGSRLPYSGRSGVVYPR